MQKEPTHGRFYFDDGATYDGYCIEAVPEGEPNAQPRRMRHGQGVQAEKGARYEGEWKDDKMHGEGKLTFPSGAHYSGTFADNKFSGSGTYVWPSGERYEGEFADNTMHGSGVYVDSDGVRWRGAFYNGVGPGLQQLI